MEIKRSRFETSDQGEARLALEVDGRYCEVYREKALRLDGEIAALGPWDDWKDYFVIIPISEKHGISRPTRLAGYTDDPEYVALVWKFVQAVDTDTFQPGPIPEDS